MSANAIVWWATLVAVIVVLALAGAQVARALREFNRAKARVAAYGDLPVMKALENVDTDMQRIDGATGSVGALVERAQTALAVIRRGPIPAELIAAAKRIGAELVALRTFASR